MGTTQTKTSSSGIDVCFMLDCTGSMGSYIDMAKNKIKEMVAQIKLDHPESEVRIGIVAYRDVGEWWWQRFEILSFTESVEKAHKFLGKLKAFGGDDCAEDVNGALQKTLFSMEWKNIVRLLVHIADAPCHGKDFHSTGDSYPEGWKGDMNWDKIFSKLVEMRIDYLLLKILSQTDKMFDRFKELAEKNGSIRAEINIQQEAIVQSDQVNQTDHSEEEHNGIGRDVPEMYNEKKEKLQFSMTEEEDAEDINVKVKDEFNLERVKKKTSEYINPQAYAENKFVEHVTKSVNSNFEKRVKKGL